MAATSTALTTKVEGASPYQLNPEQTLKASRALLKHIKTTEGSTSESKRNLFAGADDEEENEDSTPIWLTLTTKKHIIDQKRLKPAKISVPHQLNTSTSTTICLITCDPQRTFKDIIASEAFPPALGARITRVIGLTKLKTKFKAYEAQRKLFAEHDIFLADDRIITQCAKALGKTFYKTTAKRPIPVSIDAQAPRSNGKKVARAKGTAAVPGNPGTAQAVANQIEKAIQSVLVHLSPSTNTSIRVGYSSWDAEKLAENVEAVTSGLIEKFVPKKWRGVRALHIKGPETASLPIWLADEMWVDEEDVLEKGAVVVANVGKKRKAKELESAPAVEGVKKEKAKKQKLLESGDDRLDEEIAIRKEKLKKQKAAAAKDVDDDVPKATKKSKKGKGAEIKASEVGP